MCGIFGFFTALASLDAAAETLPRALAALAHRGPDDQGTATAAFGESAIGLAFTRLAILDVSPAGHQPMRGPSGELLVLNGEIYNHRALRPALEAAGVRFRGSSDSETLLHLLIHHGPAALDRVEGMFAFAYWDGRGSLLLARDRFGKKPLYYTSHATRGFAFASEVRALLATGAADRVLDREGLALWLARGSAHEPTTLVEGVRSLRPGHLMTIDARGIHERRYWSLTLEPPPPDWRDRIEAALVEAVEKRLLSDRPIGVFLSGGVDSTAIATIAARRGPDAADRADRIQAFTLTFDEAAWDEGARARENANRLGLRHHVSRLTASDALASLDAALAAQDLPSHDGFNTWFMARAAREAGLVVALAGTGGDELFAGYRHFRTFAAMLRVGALARRLPEPLRAMMAGGVHSALPTRVHKALGIAASGGRPDAAYAVLRAMFAPRVVAELALGSLPDAYEPVSEGDASASLSRLELAGYLVDTQLRDIDSMSMAHALEVRAPLLDPHLAAAVLALPSELRAPSGGVNKRLLVELAGLAPEGFRSPKRGFVLPWETWLRGPLRAWTERHLAAASEIGTIDPRALTRTVARFMRRRDGASRVLSLVALVAWCRRHAIKG